MKSSEKKEVSLFGHWLNPKHLLTLPPTVPVCTKMCVGAHVCQCVRACACVCESAALLDSWTQHAQTTQHFCTHLLPVRVAHVCMCHCAYCMCACVCTWVSVHASGCFKNCTSKHMGANVFPARTRTHTHSSAVQSNKHKIWRNFVRMLKKDLSRYRLWVVVVWGS